jgi:hypothetical protein
MITGRGDNSLIFSISIRIQSFNSRDYFFNSQKILVFIKNFKIYGVTRIKFLMG